MSVRFDPSVGQSSPRTTEDVEPQQPLLPSAPGTPDPGWLAKGAGARRAPAAADTQAPGNTSQADADAVPKAYGMFKQQLDQLEGQLHGVPASMRDALAKDLAGGARVPPSLQPLADKVRAQIAQLNNEMDALPPATGQ